MLYLWIRHLLAAMFCTKTSQLPVGPTSFVQRSFLSSWILATYDRCLLEPNKLRFLFITESLLFHLSSPLPSYAYWYLVFYFLVFGLLNQLFMVNHDRFWLFASEAMDQFYFFESLNQSSCLYCYPKSFACFYELSWSAWSQWMCDLYGALDLMWLGKEIQATSYDREDCIICLGY